MPEWSNELNELKQLHLRLLHTSPELGLELERLFETHDDVTTLLLARRALETIVIELCTKKLNRPRGSEPLSAVISRLRKSEAIPEHIAASMENLNRLGNFGAHPKPFSSSQVREALLALLGVITWFSQHLTPTATGKLKTGQLNDHQTGSLKTPRATRKLSLKDRSIIKPLKTAFLLGLTLLLGIGISYYVLKEKMATHTQLQAENDPQVLIQNGYRAFLKENYALALANYDRCIEVDPGYAAAYSNRALVHQALENWDQSLIDANQSIALDPDYAVAYSARGWTFFHKQMLPEALQDLDHAIALRDNMRWPFFYRAEVYKSKGLCEQAQQDYAKACELGHQEACEAKCS